MQYRLRAGPSMPVEGTGNFKLHTFKAEVNQVDTYLYTTEIVGSEQFRGQGGTFMSASYNRLEDVSGGVFAGKVVHAPTYVEEDDYTFL
jgi:hypothetical protein